MSLVWLVLAVLLWGSVHSWMASLQAKRLFSSWFGTVFTRGYRLFYNFFSLLTFLPLLFLTRLLPDRELYSIPMPWFLATLFGQLLAGLLLLIGVLQTDTLSFIGLRQVYDSTNPSGKLVTTGLYRWVRHPLYSAGLLFIWLTPSVSLNLLVLYISLTIYILVGAHFEERKLLREFGPAYATYQVATPMLIPGLRLPWMRAWQKLD